MTEKKQKKRAFISRSKPVLIRTESAIPGTDADDDEIETTYPQNSFLKSIVPEGDFHGDEHNL